MLSSILGFVISSFLILNVNGDGCCDDGWHMFSRDQGGWCVKIFNSSVGPTYTQAQQVCSGNGAVLSGIQNKDEFNYLADFLKGQASQKLSATMWIGAAINPICKTQSCLSLKTTAFSWTDGNTDGTDGFVWQDNNPSGNGDCLRLIVDPWGPQLDDITCDLTWAAYSLVCGKAVP